MIETSPDRSRTARRGRTRRAFALAGCVACLNAWADPPANTPAESSGTPAPAPGTAPPAKTPGKTSTPAVEIQHAEVVAPRSDNEQRRMSTAAKIVIGREEIERYGDSTLDEVLKRLPSITISGRARRGGSISMRGMGNGYTQILINGERIPPGLAIDQIVPDQVERIEIYRAPTVETGTRAIAGTINIVLREALRTHINELRVQEGDEAGRLQSNFSWIRNDVMGPRSTYNITLSVAHVDFATHSSTDTLFKDTLTGATDLNQILDTQQFDHRDNVNFTSRFQWKLDHGDQFVLQPFFNVSKIQTHVDGELDQTLGALPEPYSTSTTQTSAETSMARLMSEWTHRLGGDSSVELHASLGTFHSSSASLIDEAAANGGEVLTQDAMTDISDVSWRLTSKLKVLAFGEHSIVAGAEIEDVDRTESATTVQNGVSVLTGFGSDIEASVLREAAYVQDEWDPFPQWSANLGLRWEGIDTHSASALYDVNNDSSVLTPVAHAVWRFDPPDRDQFRVSLTRSYRAPGLSNLVALPSLSTLYPVTESNVASSPDKAGNPDLKPELASGIDLALEHYTGTETVASVSFFARHIEDLMRTITDLEAVPWSVYPRWVARPQNIGDASTRGIEFDEKLALTDLMADAPALTLRSNFSVYRSDVAGIFGPNNRIDQQPNFQSNLGFDYKLAHSDWMFGSNLSWTPPYSIQSTDTQSTYLGVRRIVDVYALWSVSPDLKIRFTLSNLSPHQYLTATTTLQGTQAQSVTTTGPTTTLAAIRLELKI